MNGWQVQEAKQRLSEVIRRAVSDGPQVVTRHGDRQSQRPDSGQSQRQDFVGTGVSVINPFEPIAP